MTCHPFHVPHSVHWPSHQLAVQARLELVNAIGQLYIALGHVLEAADLAEMYLWAERLARNPLAADDSLPLVAGDSTASGMTRRKCAWRNCGNQPAIEA